MLSSQLQGFLKTGICKPILIFGEIKQLGIYRYCLYLDVEKLTNNF